MANPSSPRSPAHAQQLISPRSVALDTIERELDRLWKESSGADENAVLRACALNLVVWSGSGESVEQLAQTVGPITAQNPCRTILLGVDPQAQSPLSASISAYCQLPARDRRQVCCEQILISAGREGIDDLSALVLSLLIPDLPAFLWWRGAPPARQDPFAELAEGCDRLIFDSAQFPDPAAGLTKLRNLAKAADGPNVGDLNWSRLRPWRQLIAQAFDPPELLGQLEQLELVEIEATGADSTPANALLLAGWLASRLGKRLALQDRSGGGPDRVLLRLGSGKPPQGGMPGLVRVRLNCGSGPSASLVLERRGPATAESQLVVDGLQRTTRLMALEEPDEERVVGSQLERLEADLVYEEALAAAVVALTPAPESP